MKDKIKIVFLFGPTASGKTSLLSNVFNNGFEVVNADSVQIYKELNIGSAKATKEEQKAIPHHLIDILPPDAEFSVADFVSLADKKCEEISMRGSVPLISGGTAYYFKNFLYGLPSAPASTPEVRAKVETLFNEKGRDYCFDLLKQVDPLSYKKLNINDTYRVKRAIEVYLLAKKPLSSFKIPNEIRSHLDVLSIGLIREKEELRKRIALRVDLMFNQGLLEEINHLRTIGASLDWQSIRGIGYREFFQFPDYSEKEIKEQIILDSIHYAKRQMTFFRSFPNVNWVNPDDVNQIKKIVSSFLNS